MKRWPGGSRSNSTVFLPCRLASTANAVEKVVLPAPPFWEMTATTFIRSSFHTFIHVEAHDFMVSTRISAWLCEADEACGFSVVFAPDFLQRKSKAESTARTCCEILICAKATGN